MCLTPTENGILDTATKVNLKPLSEVQSVKVRTVLDCAGEQRLGTQKYEV